ncbi:DoxX family protein [Hymenobacter crusticola]|uniref:DoxX family protein n=1 Tax=Hymenobacter crusticola TaxID=1770526 RepID=A0A243WLV6_9BACT|nr:DoxX family protein [Hymenobacter crusticola]OUJ76267.1 DoxX family protein [Hymenobacter crusticola]
MATTSPVFNLWTSRMLSVLRIAAGFLFMQHGMQKLFNFPPGGHGSVQLFSIMGLAGILEFAGGLLLIFGLFTRPVAFILSGLMAVAYFMAHAPQGPLPIVNQGELAVLYCFLFLFLAVAGAGEWSLDSWRQRLQARR